VLGRPYAETLTAGVRAVGAHANTSSWLDVHFNLADEPSEETLLRVLEVAQVFKAAAPGVKTSVHTSLDDPTSLKGQRVLAVAAVVDLVILNHHTLAAIHAIQVANPATEWMLYNQGSIRGGGSTRYATGLYVFLLRALGCKGHYLFALSSPGADPYYALDAREDDLSAVSVRSDGSVVSTVGMAEYRAARDDLRYAIAYRAAVASPAVPLSAAMQGKVAALDAELAAFPIGVAGGGPRFSLNHSQLDSIRLRMVEAIEAATGTVTPESTTCDGSGPTIASATSASSTAGPTSSSDDDSVDTAESSSNSSSSNLGVIVGAGVAGGLLVLVAAVVVGVRTRRSAAGGRPAVGDSVTPASRPPVTQNPCYDSAVGFEE
jgi:hypothetical protein